MQGNVSKVWLITGNEQSALQKLELDGKWRDLSVSTDYSADGLSAP